MGLIDNKYMILIFLLLITLSLIILAVYIMKNKKYDINNDYIVPKKIWCYWDDPNKIPKTVKLCMESWKKYNPDYEINLLTKQNYKNYVNIPDNIANHPNFNDMVARFSDLIRIYTLAEHGGVWIDASILINSPFEEWLFTRPAEFYGFYIDTFTSKKRYPVIENWFFACIKGSKFLRLWRDEFTKIMQYPSVEKYVESKRKYVDFQKIDGPVYLAMHIAAQKVLQIDKYKTCNLYLQKAEDGPFKYLVENEWNSEKAVKSACNNKKYHTPIMKMRGCERYHLEQKIESELSQEKCNWL